MAIVVSVIVLPACALATADYWAVNRITREYSLLEDGGLYTPIGWSAAPERADATALAARGLRHTTFPFKIECALLLASASLVVLVIWKNKKRKLPTTASTVTKEPDTCGSI